MATIGSQLPDGPQGCVLVMGAGIAGLLAALALQWRGLAVVVVDTTPPEATPAALLPQPVHRLPAALWQNPPAWLAGLPDALRAQGVGPGRLQVCSAEGRNRETQALLPDKAALQAALSALLQARPGVWRCTMPRPHLQWAGGLWQLADGSNGLVRLDGEAGADGREKLEGVVATEAPVAPLVQAAALVDASGGRRVTQAALQAACGDAGTLELSGDRQRYRSFTLAGPPASVAGLWLLRDQAGQAWLVHQAVGGLLTVTERMNGAETAAAGGAVTMASLLPRLAASALRWHQKGLLQALAQAEPAGAPVLYRAPPARRWQLPEAALAGRLPCCGVGDALVQTPPWLGQGVAQAAFQAHALATLPAAAGWPRQAAAALDDSAARQLQAAALAAWAETPAEPETPAPDTETPDARTMSRLLHRRSPAGRTGTRARPAGAAARRPVGHQRRAEDR